MTSTTPSPPRISPSRSTIGSMFSRSLYVGRQIQITAEASQSGGRRGSDAGSVACSRVQGSDPVDAGLRVCPNYVGATVIRRRSGALPRGRHTDKETMEERTQRRLRPPLNCSPAGKEGARGGTRGSPRDAYDRCHGGNAAPQRAGGRAV